MLEYWCVNPVFLLLIWTSDSVPLIPTAVFLESRGASRGVSSSAWISDRGRGFLLFNAWVTLALPWICYPRITLIGYCDLGTRVVRVMLRLWLTREVYGVYEYTQDIISMICHEFWVPVRPTQNCAVVGFVICMSYYLVFL